MTYQPTLQTTIFILLFLVLYLFLIIRKAVKNDIDLYDLLLLSTVAIVPTIFVFFPKIAVVLAALIGVGYLFFVFFGLLFLIIFIYLYRLVLKSNRNHKMIVLLVQEISLLKERLKDREDI
ncbi:MAG: DUF2304 family protein [bacterium]|nr:DUF2304 family protein [bacterium]